ncbi:MAG: YheT family hydrolase, partial [Chitinophagales bacterium]
HCIGLQKYRSIVLVGFSMGGNVSLKYLGEQSKNLHPIIRCCVAISTPIDLVGSSRILGQWQNKIYMKRFIRSLHKKVLAKSERYPDQLSAEGYSQVKNFEDFDNRYTAPIHHFRDALDYWTRSSSLPYLEKIEVPSLILNALDDSFLSADCYPYDLAQNSKNIFLETPRSGGHVGFFSLDETYYTEQRALEFIKKLH